MKNLIFFFFLFYSLFISAQICDPNYNSLYFDGSSYAALSNDNDLNATEKITVEAWIKPTQWGLNSSNGSIVCKHGWTLGEGGFVLRAGGNGELSFNIAGLDDHGVYSGWQEVESNPGAIPLNTWTHVAGTYDGKKLRIYINGSQAGILNFKGSIVPAVSYNLKIGKIADNGTYSLTVTDVLGCTATSDPIEVMSVGVVEKFNEIFISYYISEGKLFFKNVPEEYWKSRIEIVDINGKKIFNDDNIQNEIDLNLFAAGLYFLIIRSEKSVFNAKIFVN